MDNRSLEIGMINKCEECGIKINNEDDFMCKRCWVMIGGWN